MDQGKSAAIQEDVIATPTTAAQVPPGAMPSSGGQWKAGEIIFKAHQKIKVDGQPVIYEAQCVFTYSGGKTTEGTADFPTPVLDTVSLIAKKNKLREDQNYVLLDGDSQSSQFGNKLEIKSKRKLKL